MDDTSTKDTIHEEVKGKKSSKKPTREEELEKKIDMLEDQFKRAVADYRNLEKRVEEEKKDTIKFANRDLLLHLLPAFETLFIAERYVEDEGLKLTIKRLSDVLESVGVGRVKTVGERFNPELMEGAKTQEGEENVVLEELRPGFTLFGRPLMPAHVVVGKGKKVEDEVSEKN